MAYTSFNPWTQQLHSSYREISSSDLNNLLLKASESWVHWRNTPLEKRQKLFLKLKTNLQKRREEYSMLMASEMGKPVRQGLAEVDKCALLCDYYANNAPGMLESEQRASTARKSLIFFEPQGIILGIMPWNFPFWQVFRFFVPTLISGNAAILKHASNVPRCALAIEEVLLQSGFPEGVFTNIFPSHLQVSEIISSPLIRGVSLTGSNTAGIEIASIAGSHLKKVVMELGGSDPFIVFGDADMDKAVEAFIASRFQNAGQSCIAAKRLIVQKKIINDFKEKLLIQTRKLRVGNPLDPETDMGPMVNEKAVDELERQLRITMEMGGKLLCGGRDRSLGPAVFLPSVVENVPFSAPLAVEEVFGPVAPLFAFDSVAEAVNMANNTPFGLGAAVWTRDEELALKVAGMIDTGTVAVNGFVKSEPGLPFGGVKDSGFGRELSSEGLREFVNIKTVNIF